MNHQQILHRPARCHLTAHHLVVVVHHVDKTTVLISHHRLAADQQGAVQFGHRHFHPRELPRLKNAIRVVQHRPVLQGAGAAVETVVDKIQRATVRIPGFPGQADPHRGGLPRARHPQAFERGLLIGLEIDMHGIHRYQRGQQGLVRIGQIAPSHHGTAGTAIHRGSNAGVLQIQLRRIHRRTSGIYQRFGTEQGSTALVIFLTGDGATFQQGFRPARFALCQFQLASGLLQLCASRLQTCPVRTRIDLEQQITGLHQLPFLERHLVDIATDPGPQLHGLRRHYPAGKGFPKRHRLGNHPGHIHLRRRHLLSGFTTGIATGKKHGRHQCHQ